MGEFQSPVKLGRPRNEVEFTAGIDDPETLRVRTKTIERFNENSAGEVFRRVFRRVRPDYSITITDIQDALKEQIESLKHIADEPLSFFFADDHVVLSERIITTAIDTLILNSSPMTLLGTAYKAAGGGDADIIGISKVTAAYSPTGAGADLFGAGTYDAATRTVVLGSGGPEPAGTPLFVNWTYKGALVFLGDIAPRHKGGNVSGTLPRWDLSISMRGA